MWNTGLTAVSGALGGGLVAQSVGGAILGAKNAAMDYHYQKKALRGAAPAIYGSDSTASDADKILSLVLFLILLAGVILAMCVIAFSSWSHKTNKEEAEAMMFANED